MESFGKILPISLIIFIAFFIEFSQGLLKLLDNRTLVPNAREDLIYLFQFPRTSGTPSQAALNLKVEAWLHLQKIPFYRLSNQFFLGSHSEGTAPFVEFKGVHIDGSDPIIQMLGKYVPAKGKEEEHQLRTEIDDVFFKFLMYDRAYGAGLDFMIGNEGIVEQMVPLLVANQRVNVSLGGQQFQVLFNSSSWRAYFDAYNGGQKEKAEFLAKYLTGKSEANSNSSWSEFDRFVRTNVTAPALKTIFKRKEGGEASSESKLDRLLALNNITIKSSENLANMTGAANGTVVKTYAELSEQQIFNELKVRLGGIVERLRKNGGNLFGPRITPADTSLFGILIQYFETPLNMPLLKSFFAKDGQGKCQRTDVVPLCQFVSRMKSSLGLDGGGWAKLAQRPWKLNYEAVDYGHTYNGPFTVNKTNVAGLAGLLNGTDPQGKLVLNSVLLANYSGELQAVVAQLVEAANAQGKDARGRTELAAGLLNAAIGYLEGQQNNTGNKTVGEQASRLVYDSIVAYNEGLVARNVLAAVGNARAVVTKGAAASATEAEKAAAAAAVSELKIGNEH